MSTVNKELQYNFYNILAVKSGVQEGLHFVYEGRPNEPNVVMSDSKELKKYVCRNLYVFSSSENADGEIIIENECTCNYGKKIYLRILLKTNDNMNPNEIDKLFTSNNVELDLNNVLQDEDNCVYTETNDGILITFQKPVNVHSNFNGLIKNPIFKEPRNVIEGYTTVPDTDASGVMYVDASGNPTDKDDPNGFPVYTVTGDSWMECDYVPDENVDLVPLYSADLSASIDNSLGNTYAFAAILSYSSVMVALYFIQPTIYKAVSSVFNYDTINTDEVYNGGAIGNTDINPFLNKIMMRSLYFEYFLFACFLFVFIFVPIYYGLQGMYWLQIFIIDIAVLFFFLTFGIIAYYHKMNTQQFAFTQELINFTNNTERVPDNMRETFFNQVRNKWTQYKLFST